jgi:two-component system, sensor histidine kinase and response regulator
MALAATTVFPFPVQNRSLPSAARFRILVVKDNAVNQRVADLMLRDRGFKVDVVPDGKQALAAHRAEPYDLILMDLHLPVMDGWETTNQIRQLRVKQPIIVALTADVIDDVRERCLKAGMDDYLPKPFTIDQLLTVVRSVPKRLTTADTIRKAS